jgi:hypothetical protein
VSNIHVRELHAQSRTLIEKIDCSGSKAIARLLFVRPE